ncbi:MAG: amino acid ABC transporter permease [Clostridia bacterium]|nr:amino acid ABC transporter permease [Clostridia bacterium]
MNGFYCLTGFFNSISEYFGDVWDSFYEGFYKTFLKDDRWKFFLEGIENTLIIAIGATLMGILIGIVISVVKVLHAKTGKLIILNWIFEIYTTVIRGTPVVLQLIIAYNIIFINIENAVLVGIITFGINSGAYVSEIIRAGIMAVDVGQTEAGRSLGLSQFQTMRLIVLPQAIKNVLPALGNEFIALLKETSVIGYLGVNDLTRAGQRVLSLTYDFYFPYISIAIVYLLMVMGLSKLFKMLEKRFAQSDRG